MSNPLTPPRTHDCSPTLTDRQVIEFCRNGILALEGIIDKETNRRTCDFLAAEGELEPLDILRQDWFVDGLLLNPQAAGAARSLLGADFVLPHTISNHRGKCPDPEPVVWHCDGYSWHTLELNHLMMFYLPQDCTSAMGPTELVPGSHFLLATSHLVHHYGNIVGTHKAVAPAGTVFLCEPTIWHRRSRADVPGPIRNLLKYHCWRQSAPTRDWVVEEDFDPARETAAFLMGAPSSYRRNVKDVHDAVELYLWLCGRHEEFKPLGGPGWPGPANLAFSQFGIPPSLQQRRA